MYQFVINCSISLHREWSLIVDYELTANIISLVLIQIPPMSKSISDIPVMDENDTLMRCCKEFAGHDGTKLFLDENYLQHVLTVLQIHIKPYR